MNIVEKNMLFGAIGTAGTHMALEGYYNYEVGRTGVAPTEFPFIEIHEWLPGVADLIALVGVPLVFYAVGKTMRKDSLIKASKGGAVYGLGEIAGGYLYKIVKASQGLPLRYVVVRR